MFIQTESTADPKTLKFLPGRTVLAEGSLEFANAGSAERSPLAHRLFALEVVRRVALGTDFVTVSLTEAADWQTIKPAVLGVIMEHFVAGKPVLLAGESGDGGDALARAVGRMIEARIRPAVEAAGGKISLRGFAAGIATVEMSGVPASNATYRSGIENMLRHYVPEVEEVRFVAMPREASESDRPGLRMPEGIAIQALLDDEINPAVASHGGHVTLIDVKDKRAYLRLEGGCQGCGMADVTLKQGIETAIFAKVPGIEEVLDVTDHADGANPYYQPSKGGESPLGLAH